MTSSKTNGERRRAPRVAFASPQAAWIAGLPTRLVELSVSGARIEHDTPLGIRRELKLRVEIDGSTLVLSCVVTRCRLQRSASRPDSAAYCSGLRFASIDEPAREHLRRIVASRLDGAPRGVERSALTATAV